MNKLVEEKIELKGPVGNLEALLSCISDEGLYIAVICHPHPLYGGTMTNKVVHYTAKSFNEMGIPALRFNFRGVGESDGEFDNAVGEADDLVTVVKWILARYPDRKLLLAGFSFGSFVVASQAMFLKAAGLVLIAPAVTLYDFYGIDKPSCPWLLIQGDEDEMVSPEKVKRWAEQTPQISHLVYMTGASHFFHGRLRNLSDAIKDWLSTTFDPENP